MRNHNLAGAICDARWCEFKRELQDKAGWYGKELVGVKRSFCKQSNLFSMRREASRGENLSIREWDCPHCGTHHDSDVNAARNNLREGLRIRDAI